MQLLFIASAVGALSTRRRFVLTPIVLLPSIAHATAPRTVDQQIVDTRPDGTTTATMVRRYTGESTPFEFQRREMDVFSDANIEDWPSNAPWKPADFKRIDESDDLEFYPVEQPKLVYHVDEGAVAALTNYYKKSIAPGSEILDICSSWVSHYPLEFPSTMKAIVGTGINERELRANAQLGKYVQRDLNTQPTLPFADASFDVVTCVVSVDYLNKPLEVLSEVKRVLRPGGKVILSQSNRLFFTKAVRMWLALGDEGHLELIGQYLKYAGFDKRPRAFDISAKGPGAKDPMYIVECLV